VFLPKKTDELSFSSTKTDADPGGMPGEGEGEGKGGTLHSGERRVKNDIGQGVQRG